MQPTATQDLRQPKLLEYLPALALAGVTVLLALTLASTEFQPGLTSDLLWTQVFAHDLGDPLHPVSGWKFGSAPFWFPDFVLFLPLYWLCGDSGLNYPLYMAGYYLLLGAIMAWTFTAAGVARAKATVLAFLTLVLLLLCQFIPGHAHGLWLLSIPAFHGGTLLTGFAVLALGLGAVRQNQWSRRRSMILVTVLVLGLLSDALLLFHWIIPFALALWWQQRRTSDLQRVSKGFLLLTIFATGLTLIVRIAMTWTGWFFFYRLARDWPLPSLIGQTLIQFFTDFTQNGLFSSQWLFAVLALGAVMMVVGRLRSQKADPSSAAFNIAIVTGGLGLTLAWVLPMAAMYWHDLNSFRYMLNWLVVPAWMLALWLAFKPTSRRWLLLAAAAACVMGGTLGWAKLESTQLRFICSTDAQKLRAYCVKNNLREGLTDYWNEHYLRVMWDFSGPRLGQIREKDFAYFWCSNAFDYYPPALDGRGLGRPMPQFVVLNGLDQKQMTAWLGGEPMQVEQVGAYAVARLTPTQMRRAAELLTSQTEAILAGRRERWLETQLPSIF